MADNQPGSAPAGSPSVAPEAGQATQVNYEEQYKELEKKLGEQGTELGEYRDLFKEALPILEKLQGKPEIIQAIIDEKINTELAQAVLAGKVTIGDAQVIQAAQEKVEKDLGKKELDKTSPEDIAKLVAEQVKVVKEEFDQKLKDAEEMRDFEKEVDEFISRTSDLPTYAKAIEEWLEEHDSTDLRVAYFAVKGELSEKEAKEKAEKDAAEAAKNLALNAGGGSSAATAIPADSDVIGKILAPSRNPNNY